MASSKIGSLVYDIVADTKRFSEGMIRSRRQITATKKLFLESRTPIERMRIEMEGIGRIAKAGATPIDMITRSIAALSMQTKGGGREARAFAQSLREQAEVMRQNLDIRAGHTLKAAQAIEVELDATRKAAAEKLKNERATKQQAEAQKTAAAAAKKHADAIRSLAQAEQNRRTAAIQKAKSDAERTEASRLSRVRNEIAATIPPAQRLAQRMAEVRQEFAAGNITYKEFAAVQSKITAEMREISPRVLAKAKADEAAAAAAKKHADAIRALAEAEQRRRTAARDKAKADAERTSAERLARVRQEVQRSIDPARRLAIRMAEVRQEFHAGNITQKEFEAAQARIREELHRLSPAFERQQKELQESADRVTRLRQTLASLATPQQRVIAQLNDLRREYQAGNISAAEHTRLLLHLSNRYRELSPAAEAARARLERVRQTIQRSIPVEDRLQREQRELTAEFMRGTITAHEYRRALEMLRAEQARHAQQMQGAAGVALAPTQGGTFGGQVMAVAKYIGFITAGYAALRQLRQGVADALDIERTRTQFEIFTNSVSQSKQLISDLRNFAGRTPLTFGASRQGVSTLLQYGVASKDVMERLRQLGDISGGSTEQLQRLSLAFGQITAAGRLMGQENRQLIEAGFNPLQEISRTTGESMSDLKQRMADGAISAKEVGEALKTATEAGGRFANALARIGSETAFGKIQVLRGELEKLRADTLKGVADDSGFFAGFATEHIKFLRNAAKRAAQFDQTNAVVFGRSLQLLGAPGFVMSAIMRQAVEAEQTKERFKRASDEKVEHESRVTEQLRKTIGELRAQRREIAIGKDEAAIDAQRKLGVAEDVLALYRKELELLRKAEEIEKRRTKEIEKRQKMEQERAKADEKFLLDKTNEAGKLIDEILDPLHKFQIELQRIIKLEQDNFIDQQQRDRALHKREEEFIAQRLQGEKRQAAAAAQVANRGSSEEFQLLSQIARERAGNESAEERRHKAAQDARAQVQQAMLAVHGAVKGIPEDMKEFFPIPVGGPDAGAVNVNGAGGAAR